MRPQLLHLSGPLRGRTITYDDTSLEVGSAPGIDVQLADASVASRHGVIDYLEQDCAFHLSRLDGRVFVNREEVQEVILQDGDLIEWGVDGPRTRFRIYVPPGRVCKPVRRMIADARDVRKQSGRVAGAGTFARDLLTQATPKLKVGFPMIVLLLALPLAWLAGWLGSRRFGERDRADLVTAEELATMRERLARQDEELAHIRSAGAAMVEITRNLTRGVCLVHGVITLRWPDRKPVLDDQGDPLRSEYTGSGFLVGADGRVLTNRHVVTPWEAIGELQPFLQAGCLPEFVALTATFPDHEPQNVPIESIARRTDDLDVAMFRLPSALVEGIPVLPLHEGDLTELTGQRAIVVGYPTGLAALLAKAPAQLVDALRARQADMATVIAELAKAKCVSPMVTQGSIGNVQERLLVYDAQTTHGGSGGPVFCAEGNVIAVNYAVLTGFGGGNFGVPIAFGRELMQR